MSKAWEKERDCWNWIQGVQNLWSTRAFCRKQKKKEKVKKPLDIFASLPEEKIDLTKIKMKGGMLINY